MFKHFLNKEKFKPEFLSDVAARPPGADTGDRELPGSPGISPHSSG